MSEFPQDAVPRVYDALRVTEGDLSGLTLEVQQQLGGGVVRGIALGTTDGLKRGLAVENTGNPINGSSWYEDTWSYHGRIG